MEHKPWMETTDDIILAGCPQPTQTISRSERYKILKKLMKIRTEGLEAELRYGMDCTTRLREIKS